MTSTLPRRLFDSRRVSSSNVLFFLVGVTGLLLLLLHKEGGHFTYTLDDPYIHLALAERLRHGLYGLNAGEAASPSSSILWPFLLVPFAGTAFMQYAPLLLNTLFGAVTAWLTGDLLDRYYPSGEKRNWPLRLLGALTLLATNTFGLVFTGLEHSLQVLCCAIAALIVLRLVEGRRAPWWMLLPVALLPSIRYEDLAITVAVAVALYAYRARLAAGALLAAAIAPLVAFSLFLKHLGLPIFPLSVLMKSKYKFTYHGPALLKIYHLVDDGLRLTLNDPERAPQFLLTLVLLWFVWHLRRNPRASLAIAGCALASVVQVFLGPVGWLYRYELYCVMFTLLVCIGLQADRSIPQTSTGAAVPLHAGSSLVPRRAGTVTGTLLVLVGALAMLYASPLVNIPKASLNIYEQQMQMGRFAALVDGGVAINDLGQVAFQRKPDQYVLDLYGLGSFESFHTADKDKTPAWMEATAHRHGVQLVMIYPGWFGKTPPQWTSIAKLCALDAEAGVGAGDTCVLFYATNLANKAKLADQLKRFRQTLPPGTTLDILDDPALRSGHPAAGASR